MRNIWGVCLSGGAFAFALRAAAFVVLFGGAAARMTAQLDVDLQPGKKLILKETIFQEGKADVNSTAMPHIERLIVYLRAVPALEVEISGHTDNQGNLQQNLKLSFDRANTVKNLLIRGGINVARIKTRGYAAEFPLESNATQAGRAANRRVEIVGVSSVTARALTTSDGHAVEPDGEISSLRSTVQTLAPWEQDWRIAAVRQPIYEYHKINTIENSRAEVTFKDRSTLQVGENSLIVVYRPLQTIQAEGKPTENIGLVRGGLWMKLQEARRNRGETLVVKTDAGEVLMSKSGKVGTDEQGRSLISVHEGVASVRYVTSDIVTKSTITIPENFGTRLAVNTAPEKPRPLPPPPELVFPAPSGTVAAGALQFQWRKRAPKSRFEVVDSSSEQPIASVIVAEDSFSLPLQQGSYIVRLSSIDSIGLESKVAASQITVSAVVPPPKFRILEFSVFAAGAGLLWTGVLLKRKDIRYAAMVLWAIALAFFL